MPTAVQVTSSPPTHSQLTCKTSDPLWRVVRRGSAPALSPANLRCADLPAPRTSVRRAWVANKWNPRTGTAYSKGGSASYGMVLFLPGNTYP